MFEPFEAFKEDISWFIKPTDRVTLQHGSLQTDAAFKVHFPVLYTLLQQAGVLDVKINDSEYKLIYFKKGDEWCGWISKLEVEVPADLLPEHRLLLKNIGGIEESFNDPEEAFTNNQNFLFTGSRCTRGASEWTEYYHDMCEEEDITPIIVNDLVTFACEANGAVTLYDLHSGKVYLFSHDHSFENVSFMEGQPEYTFHLIHDVHTFTDFVEEHACQWRKYIGEDDTN